MGLSPKELRRTVGDALLRNNSLVSVSRESSWLGLDIAPANQGLLVLEKILYGQAGFQFRLKDGLDSLDDGFYDFILIDCPSSFGTLTLNALTAADVLVIPVQCEYFAADTLLNYIKLVQHTQEKINPTLKHRVLVTMYDRRNKICRLTLEHMQGTLNSVIFETIIEVDTKLRESPAFGQPVTFYAPATRGAEQYRALAKELLNYVR